MSILSGTRIFSRRYRKRLIAIILVGCAVWGANLIRIPPSDVQLDSGYRSGDPQKGAYLFILAGCGSCHASGTSEPGEPPMLGGGQEFLTSFGAFYSPNISTDRENGIGSWSDAELVRALRSGVSPEGQHYYPVFPYTSYRYLATQDILHLGSYLRTLPPVSKASRSHDLWFPFSLRFGIGLWKRLFLDHGGEILRSRCPANTDACLDRGAYLVRSLAHCGECHTPRNFALVTSTDHALAGAESMIVGEPRAKGIAGCSKSDIDGGMSSLAIILDIVGSDTHMANVALAMDHLTDSDRESILMYISALDKACEI